MVDSLPVRDHDGHDAELNGDISLRWTNAAGSSNVIGSITLRKVVGRAEFFIEYYGKRILRDGNNNIINTSTRHCGSISLLNRGLWKVNSSKKRSRNDRTKRAFNISISFPNSVAPDGLTEVAMMVPLPRDDELFPAAIETCERFRAALIFANGEAQHFSG